MTRTRGMLVAGALALGMLLTPVAQATAAPYRNCTEAKADGACNIPSSSPDYQAKLDRDGDGYGSEC